MRMWMGIVVMLGVGSGCARNVGEPTAAPASRPVVVGAVVSSWTGVAESRKVGPYLAGADVYVELGGHDWPREVEGKRVTVTGVAVERHDLPVFVPKAGEPVPQGIPVGEGTDLWKASARVVIEVRTIAVEGMSGG